MAEARASVSFSLGGFVVGRCLLGRRVEGSVGLEQARHFVARFDAAPAIGFPFTREREMQSQVGIGMRLGVVGNFRQPGTRHHGAGGRNRAGVQRIEAGRIDRVCDGEIVRMQDEELRSGRIAKAFGRGPRLSRYGQEEKKQKLKMRAAIEMSARWAPSMPG